jgi:hypothetical protein
MNLVRNLILFVAVVATAVPAQAQCRGEDIEGYLLRDSLGQHTHYPFLEHDGLTFEQREFIYGFNVDPALLQGTFVHFEHVTYRTHGFEFPESYPENAPPILLETRVFIALNAPINEWLTIDEFHRSLAGVAEWLGSSPEVFYGLQFSIDASLEVQWDDDEQDYVNVVVFDLYLLE